MNDFNIDDYGGHSTFTWSHEYLVSILTGGKNPIVKGLYLKNAFRSILREDFVPGNQVSNAYSDTDIKLTTDEMLDKPTVVAQMLELMKPKLGGKYLDIGTGSGWVAALIAYASGVEGSVYTVERMQLMVDFARENLAKYPSISNIRVIFGDGSLGLPEHAPYDGIHVSVAFEKIPETLINQLKIGGKLVAPTTQNDIRLIERLTEDNFNETIHRGYFFKPIKEGVV